MDNDLQEEDRQVIFEFRTCRIPRAVNARTNVIDIRLSSYRFRVIHVITRHTLGTHCYAYPAHSHSGQPGASARRSQAKRRLERQRVLQARY